jgi:Asp-tRNA(Asn)/Glu-tRNA(Gln) amidotransferase A subunit family amidase
VRTPVWERAEPFTREALAQLVAALRDVVAEVELGESFARAAVMHRTVMDVEAAHNLRRDYDKAGARLSPALRGLIERGRRHTAVDYLAALASMPALNAALDSLFDEFDAILTPAAPGEAPKGLETTGDPVFCTLWTYLGTPAVTLPLLQSDTGMPLGVQLVGRRDNDARLLRTARWLTAALAGAGRRGSSRRADGRRAPARKRTVSS